MAMDDNIDDTYMIIKLQIIKLANPVIFSKPKLAASQQLLHDEVVVDIRIPTTYDPLHDF